MCLFFFLIYIKRVTKRAITKKKQSIRWHPFWSTSIEQKNDRKEKDKENRNVRSIRFIHHHSSRPDYHRRRRCQ